ncbi:hypothetical protein HPB52_021405 [Rhipicephalus sanguineus]|uniref:Uncharacterized protein n=1 Tax=Rhipicephalus sanguineus TaxID=34632 RepID=A0A9D4PEG3_RHISA|nr:hypothetical protein HPB52_021405 [Rhipicephalus sanguineus]
MADVQASGRLLQNVSRTLEFAATGAFRPLYPVPTICCQATAGRDASVARGSCGGTILVLKINLSSEHPGLRTSCPAVDRINKHRGFQSTT